MKLELSKEASCGVDASVVGESHLGFAWVVTMPRGVCHAFVSEWQDKIRHDRVLLAQPVEDE